MRNKIKVENFCFWNYVVLKKTFYYYFLKENSFTDHGLLNNKSIVFYQMNRFTLGCHKKKNIIYQTSLISSNIFNSNIIDKIFTEI